MAKKMSAEIQLRDLINMTNGVLGLAILAMPFCFAQVQHDLKNKKFKLEF